jgi:hypothetical protein
MAAGQWWAVPKLQQGGRGDVQTFVPVQATTRPSNAIGGPFRTQARAEQWIIAHNAAPPPLPHLSNPLGFLGEIGHFLGTFVTAVTDIHTWISLGWMALGVVLLILGLIWWNRGTIEAAAGAVAGAAV